MAKIIKKIKRLNSSLKTFEHFAGKQELLRGAARVILRHPSDLLRKLRWKATHAMLSSERVLISMPKFDILVSSKDEGIAAELALDGEHEPFGTKTLLSILQENMTIVDLGSNLGYYVLSESKHIKLKKIIAIEPNPETFSLLSENVRLNHCDEVELFNIGISDTDATLPFYVSKHSNICSITPKDVYERIIEVPVLSLDSLLKREKIKKVDLVRMDIEGHEIFAIQGMLSTLKTSKPWLCMEYHSPQISAEDRETFIETLTKLDYELKCFSFRWSDYYLFGKNIADPRKVLMQAPLREALEQSPTQTLLLYLAPKSTPFELPAL